MPVSLRAAGNSEVNNQVSMVQCTLATDVADPVERLRAIQASTAQIKQRVGRFKELIPTDFPGLAAPLWAAGLSRLWARGKHRRTPAPLANVAISNVPGPPVPLYLAGAKLRHYYPRVDRRAWAGIQHHRAKLRRRAGIRPHRLQGRGRPARQSSPARVTNCQRLPHELDRQDPRCHEAQAPARIPPRPRRTSR